MKNEPLRSQLDTDPIASIPRLNFPVQSVTVAVEEYSVTPFTIAVPDGVLDDLKARLNFARFPDQLNGAQWNYGTELSYMKELIDYWRNEYDWRKSEAELNQWDHYKTSIKNLDIHFIHQQSKHENAMPLLITHGWPGSVYEFMKILGPLTDPEAHGGTEADAFHVVCPSIPGYGFSEAPHDPGFDIQKVAEVNISLMAKLGYLKYGVQGGDWGAPASAWAAHLAPEHVRGVHLNMILAQRPKDEFDPPTLGDQDLERIEQAKVFMKNETGYQGIQSTKPQTLGYALSDSPVGLAAWLVEKFNTWSDGDLRTCFTMDQLLTNIMIYWTQNCITSSMRLYYESIRSNRFGPPGGYVEAPTAFAVFPRELTRLPRAWAEESFNIRQWTEMPQGGHFAAMEEPELLVNDIRSFFGSIP